MLVPCVTYVPASSQIYGNHKKCTYQLLQNAPMLDPCVTYVQTSSQIYGNHKKCTYQLL